MTTVFARVRRFYGAGTAHLLAVLGCFALTGYVVFLLAGNPSLPAMLLWFACAVAGHDLLLFPLYTVADRFLNAVIRTPRPPRDRPAIGVVNHIRVPALAAGLLFLLFFPGIVRQGAGTYGAATGQTQEPFLGRWLLITVVLFLLSGALYAVRAAARRWHSTGSGRSRPKDDP